VEFSPDFHRPRRKWSSGNLPKNSWRKRRTALSRGYSAGPTSSGCDGRCRSGPSLKQDPRIVMDGSQVHRSGLHAQLGFGPQGLRIYFIASLCDSA